MPCTEEDGLLDDTIVFFYAAHGSCTPCYKRFVRNRGQRAPRQLVGRHQWREPPPTMRLCELANGSMTSGTAGFHPWRLNSFFLNQGDEQLYDLQTDSDETINLVADPSYASKLAIMSGPLDNRHSLYRDGGLLLEGLFI